MTTSYIDSLTLNSIGLIGLGLALLAGHIYNRWKLRRGNSVAVIEGIRESLFSKLLNAKYLFVGVGFIAGGFLWSRLDYNQYLMDCNLLIIQQTKSEMEDPMIFVIPEDFRKNQKKLIREMEMNISMSILDKQITKSNNEWYSSTKGLSVLAETKKPICIQLYEIYNKVPELKQLERLDKLYGEFYEDYWGSEYELRKKRNRAYPEVVRELMEELDYDEENAWRFAPNYIDDWLKTGTLPLDALFTR